MGTIDRDVIKENLGKVKEEIALAAASVNRSPEEVTLVVVTKAQPLEVLEAAVAAGAQHLGENYADEGQPKIEAFGDHPDLQWHMIGHVQRRKAAIVARQFHYMHSLDSVRLARRLNRFLEEAGRRLPVLLEYNVTAESSKFGWPAWEESTWPKLLPEIEEILTLDCLDVRGLMTIGPFLPNPEDIRPYYQKLGALRFYLADHFPQIEWRELSMGMSGDFQVAIQEGATLVRVGQAILGPRPLKSI